MFCTSCGKDNMDGAKFCEDCGERLIMPTEQIHYPDPAQPTEPIQAAQPGAPAYAAQPTAQYGAAVPAGGASTGAAAGTGFWRSGPGIALIVVLGLLVAGGITLGIILAVRGGGSDDAENMTEVWEEYEKIAKDAEKAMKKANAKDSKKLKGAKEAHLAAKKKTDALKGVARKVTVPKGQEKKQEQLESVLDTYSKYANAAAGMYGTVATSVEKNTLAEDLNKINNKVDRVQELIEELIGQMDDFIDGNQFISGKPGFDPQDLIGVLDDFDNEVEEVASATQGIEQGVPTEEPQPAPGATSSPYAEHAGNYTDGYVTIVLYQDGTYSESMEGYYDEGTYSVSGGFITFSGNNSGTWTCNIGGGTITYPDGTELYWYR